VGQLMPVTMKILPFFYRLFLGWVFFMFFPFFNYNKFVRDAFTYTAKTVGRQGPTCKVIDGTYFGWTEIASV
jgi:hypothetical protein